MMESSRMSRLSCLFGLVAAVGNAADVIEDWEVQLDDPPRELVEQVVDAPNDMSIFLLVGQSNMSGRVPVSEEDRLSLPHVYKLDRDDRWVPASSPLHYDRRSAGIGPANTFVKLYGADHPDESVGLVPCAVGGSHLATWAPNGTGKAGANFRRALARVKVAKAKGRFVGILWHQGEADGGKPTGDPKVYYPKMFRDMVMAFRSEIGDVPVIVGEIGRFLPEET